MHRQSQGTEGPRGCHGSSQMLRLVLSGRDPVGLWRMLRSLSARSAVVANLMAKASVSLGHLCSLVLAQGEFWQGPGRKAKRFIVESPWESGDPGGAEELVQTLPLPR